MGQERGGVRTLHNAIRRREQGGSPLEIRRALQQAPGAVEQALAHAEAPTKLYATETCVICLEELSAAEAQPLRCGHTYHAACIAEWCSRAGVNPRCPTCMQPIHWQRAATEAALLVQ